MRKLFLSFLFLSTLFCSAETQPINNYTKSFNKAYQLYPAIPKGILEAVSFSQTRFTNIQPTAQPSCSGVPQVYGPMGLTLDGKNYFRDNLKTIAATAGYSIDEVMNDAEKNILAYAKAYNQYLIENAISSDIDDQYKVLVALSELPSTTDLTANFALSSQLYQVYWFLNNIEFQEIYNFPDHHISLSKVFGDNLFILSAKQVIIKEGEIKNQVGQQYKMNSFQITQSADYAPALWNAAASCNYSLTRNAAISAITIHDVEGSYSGCIGWFQNCAASASAHYVLRSSDGQVTQMVLEAYKAWHVGSENPYTIGLEHEGYAATGYNWYGTVMLTSSANLCRDICNSGYGIDPLRTYNGPACSGSCVLGGCVKIKGHQHYPNQTHSDPGPYWNWYKFYTLINNSPSVNTLTATSGTFYDSGGPTGNYLDDERYSVLIQPPGATNVTLNFTAFDLELNWDYMYIYDGASTSDPLIGRFTGTSSPGLVSSTGGSLLIDFRSDCNTTATGWIANYNSNAVPPPPIDNVVPTTNVATVGAWETQNFTATITDQDNSGGTGVQKGYYQVIDFDGTEWRANNSNGFFADNFDAAIHPEWTQKTGTWSINNQALLQSDDVPSNTNIYASLDQSLSNRYLYHFTASINGTGVNRRGGFHFFCDNGDSLNRNNSYFVWFRVDQSALQIYKVINDNFGTAVLDVPMTVNAGQAYDYKVIYDRTTGKMWVYQDNALVTTYTDPSPYFTGDFISFRTGNATMAVNELKVYRSRSASVNVSVGAATTNDARYQNPNPATFACKIKSICQDSAENLSSIFYHDINIDWTAPLNIDSIRDGLANDISITNSLTQLEANWDNSFDQHSGILNYWYCIGTTPGDSDVVAFTSIMGAATVTKTGLTLTNGQLYYFTVKAENGAGLFSPKISSNGQIVNTAVGINALENAGQILIYPNPFTDFITVAFPTETIGTISVYDAQGRLIVANKINAKESKIASADWAPGVYLMEFVSSNGSRFLRKVVK